MIIYLYLKKINCLRDLFRAPDHSPPSSTDVKECVKLYLYSPIRLHGVVLS